MTGSTRPPRSVRLRVRLLSVVRPVVVAVLLAALMTVLIMVGSAQRAAAAPTSGDGNEPPASSSICGGRSFDTQYLPVQRWSGATQTLHVRSNGGMFDTAPVQRSFQGVPFAVGDFVYSLTVRMVSWSTQFCPLDKLGGLVDTAGAAIGQAFINSMLLTTLLLVGLVALIVQAVRRRGTGFLKQALVKIAVLAVFAIMVAGSTHSRGGGINNDYTTPYSPGAGSPGWFATTIDKIVGQLAAAPASAIPQTAMISSNGEASDELDCASYLKGLQRGYQTQSAPLDGTFNPAAVPAMTVSNLWQISGYSAWSAAQFGNKNVSGLNRVACRMLDRNANVPVTLGSFTIEGSDLPKDRSAASVTDVMSRVPAAPIALSAARDLVKPNAPAWRPLAGVEADKGWVAWAACVPADGKLSNLPNKDGWHVPAGDSWLIADEAARKNSETPGGSARLNLACWHFFNTDGVTVDPIFDWGEGDKELNNAAAAMPASTVDFISSLHGTNQAAGGAAGVAYLLSAAGVALVFGGLALMVLIAKMLAVIMLFSVFFLMLATLLPNANTEKLITYTKQYIGLSLFIAFSLLVMAMITLITKLITVAILWISGGTNSVVTMTLGGLSPVIAAIGLHFAFRRIGMPSPLTLKGAMGWGSALAGGAGGSALATGVGQISDRVGAAAKKGSSRLAGQLTGGGGSKDLPGRRSAQPSGGGAQKSPIAAPATSGASAASGIAAGALAASALSAAGSDEPAIRGPEDVLADRNASAAAKRAAQRQLAEENRAVRAEQRTEQDAARQARQDQNRARTARRATLTPTQRGQELVSAAGSAARTGVQNRALDLQRWAKTAASHPIQTLRSVPVPAATLLGAMTFGGVPGVAAVTGGVAAKRAAAAVQRRVRTRSQAKQQAHQAAVQAYRRRQLAAARPEPVPSREAAAPADRAERIPAGPSVDPFRPSDPGRPQTPARPATSQATALGGQDGSRDDGSVRPSDRGAR